MPKCRHKGPTDLREIPADPETSDPAVMHELREKEEAAARRRERLFSQALDVAKLPYYRRYNKPTLREISQRTGLSESFLGKLERGEYETLLLETMRQVAKGYGLPLEKLLAVSGYVNWQEPPLPDLPIYLRTKYGLTEEGIREAERFMKYAESQYGKTKRK